MALKKKGKILDDRAPVIIHTVYYDPVIFASYHSYPRRIHPSRDPVKYCGDHSGVLM